MRVTRTQAEENRNRVIDVAARLFRERGFDGIGISDLMAVAGLTHGGFYNNFASKDELAALACSRALEASRARLRARAAESKGNAYGGLVRAYLSKQHRDDPGHGCALTTLATESPRRDAIVQSTINSGIEAYLALILELVPGEGDAKRSAAITSLAAMVGAVILSRATTDKKLSAEILNSVEADLNIRHPEAAPAKSKASLNGGRSPSVQAKGRQIRAAALREPEGTSVALAKTTRTPQRLTDKTALLETDQGGPLKPPRRKRRGSP